jgi:hypothetical protein
MKKLLDEFSNFVLEKIDKFSGHLPETVAIAIVLKARSICRVEKSCAKLEEMFSRQIDDQISDCQSILD